MAKAPPTKVYILAKELNIKSKDIIDRCQAQGIDIVKTHMSPVSAGLEATVRQWFVSSLPQEHVQETKSDAPAVEMKDAAPVVEVAAPGEAAAVDKVEIKVEETSPVKAHAQTPAEVPVQETPVQETPAPAEQPSVKKPAHHHPNVVKTPHPRAHIKPVMNVPVMPAIVAPAGPRLNVPAPAVLKGPNIIRVEKPEPVSRPHSNKRHKDGADSGSQRGPRPAGSRHGERQGERQGGRPDRPGMHPASPSINVLPVKPDNKKVKKTKDDGSDASSARIARSGVGKHKVLDADMQERKARLAAVRGGDMRNKPSRKIESGKRGFGQQISSKKPILKVDRPEKAFITEPITVKDLAAALSLKVNDIILKLMQQKVYATANQSIATEVAEMIALEFGTELEVQAKRSIEEDICGEFETRDRKKLKKRPAIVTMLGHVDHGKTSLLDKIRSAAVASGEAGGITQHIGAYQAELNDKKVTFLDTPGHAAFTAMRARGANMTDIVVLVVAADDGVMPQTVEAIRHAQAANVTIIVALNKIDLPGIDVNRVYGQLAEHKLVPIEWGGDTEVIKTSAQTGEGIAELIEHIDLIADLNEYQADSTIPATGWVVESKMTTTQGVVATLLLKEGRLRKGDTILAGAGFGKVRNMRNSFGKPLKEATSSMPVEVTGLSEVPLAGDRFYVIDDLNRAKNAAEENKTRMREESLAKRSQVTLDNLFSHIAQGRIKELNLIVRADVQGSVDVLVKHLIDLGTAEIKIKVLHAAVGGVTEGDVVLAEASSAIIIGFNVVPEGQVKQLADSKGVDIRLYSIIYRIAEDIRAAMLGMLEPEEKESSLGKLVVRNTFRVPGVGTIAGCYVTNGIIKRGAKLRLIRNNIVIKDSCEIESLKHFKEDVREARAGYECGVKIANFDDIKLDDSIEAYEIIKVARTLD